MSAVAISFVFTASNANFSAQKIVSAFALNDKALLNALFFIFAFMSLVQFLFFLGPNTTHHFLLIGDPASPTLALPVPFCLYNFLPDLRTSDLVFVCAVD